MDGTGLSSLAFVSDFCDRIIKLIHRPTGSQLKTMLERAFKWAKIQREVADSMTKTWIEYVPGWRLMLLTYKKDPSMPNPFRVPDPGTTFSLGHIIIS